MSSFAPTVLKFEAFPDRNLTVILFKDVTNAKDVLDKLLARTLEPEVALVNPRPIQSLFALRLAAHKALASRERNALTTRTLHSELVYNLSASKHITEGLRRFGMDDASDVVLACRFDASDADLLTTPNRKGQMPENKWAVAIAHRYVSHNNLAIRWPLILVWVARDKF